MSPGAGDGSAWRDGLIQLGPDWVLGADGVPFRRAARVLLLDADDRLLLARGHDVDEPTRHWWFTIGGGIDPGETPRQAAARELREEAGLTIDPSELVGPVLTRTALFDFARRTVRQDEEFFLLRLSGPADVAVHGWTELERRFMDELRWWDLASLATNPEQVFPADLAGLVRDLLTGWDGTTVVLAEQP